MKKFLQEIRKSNKDLVISKKIINSIMILILGVELGVFSKWLDNLSLDDNIWWNCILDTIDLGNVFSALGVWILIAICISIYSNTCLRAGINVFLFFLGMCISYHLYTIVFAGFNPMNYMMIWYSLTLISPFLAFVCWYAKGKGVISFIINVCIITFMIFCTFGIGMWYFDFTSVINTIFFIALLIVLYQTPKKCLYSLMISILLAYIITFLRFM